MREENHCYNGNVVKKHKGGFMDKLEEQIYEKLLVQTDQLLDESAYETDTVKSVRLLNVVKDNLKIVQAHNNEVAAKSDKKQNRFIEVLKIAGSIVGGTITAVAGGIAVEVIRGKIRDRQIDKVIKAEKDEHLIFTTSPGKSLTKF